MDQHQDGFEKIDRTEQHLYGPRKLLLCGFSSTAQGKFKSLLDMLGLENLPLVWAGKAHEHSLLSDLLKLAEGSNAAQSTGLPRAIIASGIQQKELHRLMNGCRKAGMQSSLWAVLTPTSENWPLSQLLAALVAEAKAMAKTKKK